MQWRACVETILHDQSLIASENFLTVRYECFLKNPETVLQDILEFLDIPFSDQIKDKMPAIKSNNYNKWVDGFTKEEKSVIGPILQPLLTELGYTTNEQWYES